MKVFNKHLLLLITGVVVFLSLSCNKDIYEKEIKSTNIPYNIKQKVDVYLLKNQHLFPNKIIPTILWNSATVNDSYIDVEVKFTKDKSIFLPVGAVGDGNLKFGKTFYKINMVDISNIYVYNIIPENYKVFAKDNITIQNIRNADFNGYVTIANIFKDVFVVMQFEKGKVLQYSKEISLEKIDRNTKKIKERWWKCWWWSDYTETQINNGEPDLVVSNSNDFFGTSNSSTGQVQYQYTLGVTCVWVPYDDGFGDGNNNGGGESWGDDATFCDRFPYLCDGGGGGGVEIEEEEECNGCHGPTQLGPTLFYHWPRPYVIQWGGSFADISSIFGYFDYNYSFTELDCKTGAYLDHIEIKPHLSLCHVNEYAKDSYLWERKKIKCGFRINHRFHVAGEIELHVVDVGIAALSGIPFNYDEARHKVFDIY